MAKIAIIGSGLVGRAWAISFARAGHDVALWDAKPEAAAAALGLIESVLPDLAANELLGGAIAGATFARACASPRRWRRRSTARATSRRTRPRTSSVKRHVFARLDAAARAGRRPGELHLGDPAVALHRGVAGPRALPRRPPDQSALSHSGGRDRARAVDGRRRSSSARRR